ncbi:MAG: alpha-N-arabinofuranosidase [Syntrophaceae bacterium]|nr:alpha-N-arabinofuranosidase [Syntrophaceae bacterium]
MIVRIAVVIGALLVVGFLWLIFSRSKTVVSPNKNKSNQITIYVQQGKERIAPEIYGHFAEHLGRCIYDGFWVGKDSYIPNIRGIRNDVVEALKKIQVPVLRWPGGCFADEYHWRDGIGWPAKRLKTLNNNWGGVETNQFGTHEFMDLCEQLGCQPYVAGNLGSGTVEEIRSWIEYMTSDSDSSMASLRRRNGRDKPWKVPYFGIGNENWGCGGNMTAEYYADLYRNFQTYVRNYSGNKIIKVACGPGGGDTSWTDVVMKKASRYMDAIDLHYYVWDSTDWSNKGSAVKFGEKEWFSLMKNTLQIDNVIAKNLEIMDKYDPEKRVALFVCEWGTWWAHESGESALYQQNTLRDAVSAGIFLNIFNSHCDRVKMANIAQINNVLQAMILTRGKDMIVTPTYHVFEMFKVHQGATLLPADISCPSYKYDKEEIPSLIASASKNDSGVVHISLCNLDPNNDVILDCKLEGLKLNKVTGRVLTDKNMNAHNTFEKPDSVKPTILKDITIKDNIINVMIPSKSVVVLAVSS